MKWPLFPCPYLQRDWLFEADLILHRSSRNRNDEWGELSTNGRERELKLRLYLQEMPNVATLEMLRALNKISKSSPSYRIVLPYISYTYTGHKLTHNLNVKKTRVTNLKELQLLVTASPWATTVPELPRCG